MSKYLRIEIIGSIIKIALIIIICYTFLTIYNYGKELDKIENQHKVTDSLNQQNIDTVIIHGIKYIKIK